MRLAEPLAEEPVSEGHVVVPVQEHDVSRERFQHLEEALAFGDDLPGAPAYPFLQLLVQFLERFLGILALGNIPHVKTITLRRRYVEQRLLVPGVAEVDIPGGRVSLSSFNSLDDIT